jgi:hypothetical protein
MKTQLKMTMKKLPSIPVYIYLVVLAITSTSLFIVLLRAMV